MQLFLWYCLQLIIA